MSNLQVMLRNVMTGTYFHGIDRGPAEELQEELDQNLIPGILLKEGKEEVNTVVADQET